MTSNDPSPAATSATIASAQPHTNKSEAQVQVRFHTRQKKHAVTDTPILVPSRLRRYGLSEIINHLLATGKPLLYHNRYSYPTLSLHHPQQNELSRLISLSTGNFCERVCRHTWTNMVYQQCASVLTTLSMNPSHCKI